MEFFKPTRLKLFFSFLLTFLLTFYVYVYNSLLVNQLIAKTQTSSLPPCPPNYLWSLPLCHYSGIRPATTKDIEVFIICILLSFAFFYYSLCTLIFLAHELKKQTPSAKLNPVTFMRKSLYFADKKDKEVVFKQMLISAVILSFVVIWISPLLRITVRVSFERFYGKLQRPNKLVVTRPATDRLAAFTVSITDEAKVRRLYEEILALPTFSASLFPFQQGVVMHCPAEYATKYLLDFYLNNSLIMHGVFTPTGCAWIKLDNMVGRRAGGGLFVSDLQQTLGLTVDNFYGYPPVYSPPL
jgi:hypothetical protein